MTKKIGIGIGVVVVIALLVALYYNFKPNGSTASTKNNNLISETVAYEDITTFLNSNDDEYVLVLTDGGKDSKYVLDTILLTLSLENESNPLPKLVEVDMSSQENISVTRLESVLKTNTYPALVHVVKGEIKGTYTFKEDNYVDTEVKEWLFNNNLWNAPYIVNDAD